MEPKCVKNRERLFRSFLLVWVCLLLLTPAVVSLFGEIYLKHMVGLGVLALLLALFIALDQVWSRRKMISMAALVVLLSFTFEAIGVKTGMIFGAYHYSVLLGIRLLGVPLLIPFAWLMMLVPAWGVAELLLGRMNRSDRGYRFCHAFLSGCILTGWDLYVDPQMVQFGVWTWHEPSGYFGTPWVNFFGWWALAFLLSLLIRPRNLPQGKMLVIYGVTWFLQAIGLGFVWGQPYPAICGFVGMGLFVGWGLIRFLKVGQPSEQPKLVS